MSIKFHLLPRLALIDALGFMGASVEVDDRSIPLSKKRVLLKSPNCRVWFLGERIHSWRLGVRVRHPPITPPRHMLWDHLLEGEELDQAFQGDADDDDELCDRRRSQYSDFICTQLL